MSQDAAPNNTDPAQYNQRKDQAVDNFFAPQNDSFYASNIYKPLQTERKEIRLIHIVPGRADEPLRLELKDNVSLVQDDPNFLALSYCAGNVKDTVQVFVQGLKFNIFASLAQALKELRAKELIDQLVWIDQVCIDQSNIAERDQQVLLMPSVYSKAWLVLVWVGSTGKKRVDEIAIKFLEDLYFQTMLFIRHRLREAGKVAWDAEIDVDVVRENDHYLSEIGWQLYEQLREGNCVNGLRAVSALSQLRYWRRCWCFQEIALAKKAELCVGSFSLTFEMFRVAQMVLAQALATAMDAHARGVLSHSELEGGVPWWVRMTRSLKEITDINEVLDLFDKYQRDGRLPMREVLNVARNNESTDPRDRVYSLLGLMKEEYQIRPRYDASNTAEDVLVNATIASIEVEKSLNILSDGRGINLEQTLRLPSWTPNFTTDLQHLSLCPYREGLKNEDFAYDASLTSHHGALSIPKPNFMPDSLHRRDRILRCSVLDLGLVALSKDTLSLSSSWNASQEEEWENLNAGPRENQAYKGWTQIVASVFGETGTYPHTNEPIHVAFDRTVSLGRDRKASKDGSPQSSMTESTPRAPEVAEDAAKNFIAWEVCMTGEWAFFITPDNVMGVSWKSRQGCITGRTRLGFGYTHISLLFT